jgi:hemerythrin-like domain-containing protein
MAATLDGTRDGDTAAGRDLRNAAIGFIDLITAHIAKENGILFNIADEMITGSVRDTLLADYAGVAGHLYEEYSRDELLELGEEIVNTFNQGV